MKKAVFFDLYGTLIDIRTDELDPWVYEMLSRYLAYQSVNISSDELKNAYSDGVQERLRQSKEAYPEIDVYKVFFDIMNKFGKKRYSKGTVIDICMLFRSLTIRHFSVFNGLYDALAALARKYSTAIISDAQWVFAEPEIAMLGLDQFFKQKFLSSKLGFKKPDVRMFFNAMERIGASAHESVFIGDNPRKDLSGAKMSGMKFVLFRAECGGYGGFIPDGCFSEYSELEKILNEIF